MMNARGSRNRFLWLAVVVAVLLRLALVGYAEVTGRFAFGDGRFYVDLGKSLAAGRGLSISGDLLKLEVSRGPWLKPLAERWRRAGLWDFIRPGRPTAFVMPAYPLFVGAAFSLFGPRVIAVRLLQILAAAGVTFLFYYVAKKAFDRGAGLAAAWVYAVYPFFVFFAASVTNQLFSIAALLGVVALYYFLNDRPTGRRAALFGLVAGGAFLTRAEMAVVAALCAAGYFWRLRRRRTALRPALSHAAVITGVAVAVATPWAVRNYLSLNKFSYLPTQGPRVFWEANAHPLSEEFEWGEVPAYAALYEKLRQEELPRLRMAALADMPKFSVEDEFTRAEILQRRVSAFVRANPRVYFQLCWIRARQFLRFAPLNFSGLAYRAAYWAYAALLITGGAGLILSLRDKRAWLVYALLFYAASLLIFFIYGTAYRVAGVDVWLTVFTGVTVNRVAAVFKRRGKKDAAVAV